MTDERTQPTGIVHARAQHELRINWADGHESVYDLTALRDKCPCAACRGGHRAGTNTQNAEDPDVITLTPVFELELREIQQAGNYALNLVWSDGHDAGFYTWAYLRDVCMCGICQPE